MVMRARVTVRRAARRWHLLVGIRWQRVQCFIAARYYQRVTAPVRAWQACGSPACLAPSIPWWQPFAYLWLRRTGWLTRRR
jgi:hypothetical protein